MLLAFGPQFEHGALYFLFWTMILVGVVWIKRHVDLARGRSQDLLRPDETGPSDAALPRITFLIAGKDEEANLPRCVESLLKQDYPNLEIILVNDRSDDRTGAIIDEFAARDPRVTAVHVKELPAGWFGKNHAMHLGVQKATGDWLCFSDADCCYESPRLVSAAMRYALRTDAEFVSILPQLEALGFWERVIQPVNGAVMLYWYPPQHVNNPRSRIAYANGAFMLMSRGAYERLGGHEPVRATLNEDMHLARRAKALGLRLRVVRGGDMYRVRMYRGFRQIWRGWARIFYGCLASPLKLIVSLILLAVFSFGPVPVMLLAPLMTANWPWLMGAGAFAFIIQQSVLWPMYKLIGSGGPWALSYPLGAFFSFFITLESLAKSTGLVRTTWRGTTYQYGAKADA